MISENDVTGVIEIVVKLRLECDVTKEEAEELVAEVDYNFDHPLIDSTEIVGDDIVERF